MKYFPDCGQNYPGHERLCPNDGQLLSLPDPYHLVGRTLMDKYRIDALMGVGGMGAVYSAHHLTINRRVAFKILLPNLPLGNRDMLSYFQREAELAGQLSHENIVHIYDAGQTSEGIAYIVMEWLEGHTLEDELLEKRMLSLERAAAILHQIASALDHAHERHIIHRDLKPKNIMIIRRSDGREQVKVVDFGIAKAVSEATSSLISSLIGTPHYASPEQFVMGGRIDRRSDIYSLGVLLFEMLSGHLPFSAQSHKELIRMQREESPPSIKQYRADAPEEIDKLLFRMLAKNPDDRPQTAREASAYFAHALKAGLGRRPTFVDINSPTIKEAHAKTYPQDAIPTSPRPVAAAPEQANAVAVQSATSSGRKLKKYSVIAILGMAITIAGITLGRHLFGPIPPDNPGSASPTPTQTPRIELMSYYLEISSDQCQTFTRGTGDESLDKRQGLRIHFIPRRNGYLYIIAPGEKNVPTTFLTAQSDRIMGVRTNFLETGTDYSFPSGAGAVNCFEVINEPQMALTVIFSPTLLASPSFLAEQARRKLSGTEQNELENWRRQYANSSPQFTHDAKQQQTHVTVLQESGMADKPLIFDLTIKSP